MLYQPKNDRGPGQIKLYGGPDVAQAWLRKWVARLFWSRAKFENYFSPRAAQFKISDD